MTFWEAMALFVAGVILLAYSALINLILKGWNQ